MRRRTAPINCGPVSSSYHYSIRIYHDDGYAYRQVSVIYGEPLQTRTLTLHEVIDELHAGSELVYSIHRPTRGWYIRVRSHKKPTLLADLIPDPLVDTAQPDADSILIFTMPSVKGKERESVGSSLAEQDEYSFPPTPPSDHHHYCEPHGSPSLAPPTSAECSTRTPRAASARSTDLDAARYFPRLGDHFPYLLVLRGTMPATTPALESGPRLELERVLEYEDTTPVFSVSQMTGVITVLNDGYGDTGLLVACAMAYLDFLAERDGYIASANGG
ncbi:hypothetical protein RHS01_09523 [Rhizoctonia solani]|uniref:Uncharacterized protein n=1 Tax=Rhizoctonia solani TaxID=456999 RepID=A0A8H7M3C6_9AGAM|nr:hypothetical protein RHS01_09523 [Rhizoctonia solani]